MAAPAKASDKRDAIMAAALDLFVERGFHGTAVPEIASAVPFDLANILVDSQDAEHADQLLSDEGLRDPHLWDVLAASYFEVGKDGDAVHATSTALQLAPREAPATTCHRLTREILLGSDALGELVRKDLDRLSLGRAPDPTCIELAATP